METQTPLSQALTYNLRERRRKPRVNCSYPATLRSGGGKGARYESRAVLANMSACGMYLRTKHSAQPGERLFVVVRLSTAPLELENKPHLAALGSVVRVEPKSDGTYGIALELHRHRFL